jgi:hypothetical protein
MEYLKIRVVRAAPLLIATTFRNVILWFPWAWICYTSLRRDISMGRKK